jgi:HD-GYP domain-containing protein (c-di-GMP phosphodiesterase class II)
VDFVVSPYSYAFRGLGGDCLPMQPGESLRHHGKIYFMEEDSLMHDNFDPGGRNYALENHIAIYQRNFAQAITHGQAVTWFEVETLREHPSLEALGVLGTQTAVALRNARAVDSARDLYFATLRALALAMETKDPYARGTTDRVVRYATALGREMGLDEQELQSLEVASLLHDIGMSATGETVVACDRPLSTFERGLLKLHPVLAAEILEEVPALKKVIPIVYHHHERYDGEGYVVGLSGESIPLGSRILAIADAFTAMTSKRPYRGAMTVEQALEELEGNAGSQFDPEVVRAFVEMMRREGSPAPDEARG